MNFDFSKEDEQQQFNYGPIPAGSVVITRLRLLDPMDNARAPENPLVKLTQSGLRQLYVELEVTDGRYKGVSWRQSLTLPYGMQQISLSEGQETACRIGGAKLKAILQAAKRPLNVSDLRMFDGLRFPVKVRIDPREKTSRSGTAYWVNEIDQVITPDKEEYARVQSQREIINPNGAVSGSREPANKSYSHNHAYASFSDARTTERTFDDVPF